MRVKILIICQEKEHDPTLLKSPQSKWSKRKCLQSFEQWLLGCTNQQLSPTALSPGQAVQQPASYLTKGFLLVCFLQRLIGVFTSTFSLVQSHLDFPDMANSWLSFLFQVGVLLSRMFYGHVTPRVWQNPGTTWKCHCPLPSTQNCSNFGGKSVTKW